MAKSSNKDNNRVGIIWGGFETAHIDAMLWQFCLGMLELANGGCFEGDCGTLNECQNDRVIHLYKIFKVKPSFMVVFDYRNGRFTVEKKTDGVEAFLKSKGVFD